MELKELLVEKYNISEADLNASLNYFSHETIKAKDFFLEEGKVSDRLAYIKSGLFRSFIYNDNADEITTHFFQTGEVLISMESFNNQTPAEENITALEDSSLQVISYQSMMKLFEIVPIWKQIAKDVSEIKFNNMLNRSKTFQTLSAKERYLQLLQNNPELLQKVPLRHIASYLGIDIATLSRIRKNL